MTKSPSPKTIEKHLTYLRAWFAQHPTWAYKDNKPIIFVYNDAGCDTPERWMEASHGEWYVVMKLFPGFESCHVQPNSWHQYGSGKENNGVVRNKGYSYVISPGF
mmetsp:Transcript_21395/g.38375  ORF Transcript_21395/g.38375 Transcript_21395/m.38375 type:complete len:105 (+) Transcript_21395:1-315(+)